MMISHGHGTVSEFAPSNKSSYYKRHDCLSPDKENDDKSLPLFDEDNYM